MPVENDSSPLSVGFRLARTLAYPIHRRKPHAAIVCYEYDKE